MGVDVLSVCVGLQACVLVGVLMLLECNCVLVRASPACWYVERSCLRALCCVLSSARVVMVSQL